MVSIYVKGFVALLVYWWSEYVLKSSVTLLVYWWSTYLLKGSVALLVYRWSTYILKSSVALLVYIYVKKFRSRSPYMRNVINYTMSIIIIILTQ